MEQYSDWQARNRRRKREIDLFMLSNSRAFEVLLKRKFDDLAKAFSAVMKKHQREVLELQEFDRRVKAIESVLPWRKRLDLIGLERTNTDPSIAERGTRRKRKADALTTEELIRRVDAIFEGYWKFGLDSRLEDQSLIIVKNKPEGKEKDPNIRDAQRFELPRLPTLFNASLQSATQTRGQTSEMLTGEDSLTLPAVKSGKVSLTKEETSQNFFLPLEIKEDKENKELLDYNNSDPTLIRNQSRREKLKEKLNRTTSIPKLTRERSFLVGKVNDNSGQGKRSNRTASQLPQMDSANGHVPNEYKMPAITQGRQRLSVNSSDVLRERNKENVKRASKMKYQSVDNIINTQGNEANSLTPLPALQEATMVVD